DMGLGGYSGMRKQDLIYLILEAQAEAAAGNGKPQQRSPEPRDKKPQPRERVMETFQSGAANGDPKDAGAEAGRADARQSGRGRRRPVAPAEAAEATEAGGDGRSEEPAREQTVGRSTDPPRSESTAERQKGEGARRNGGDRPERVENRGGENRGENRSDERSENRGGESRGDDRDNRGNESRGGEHRNQEHRDNRGQGQGDRDRDNRGNRAQDPRNDR